MASIDDRGDVTTSCSQCATPIDGVKTCHPDMVILCEYCMRVITERQYRGRVVRVHKRH
jgi:hypothetical protein